MANYKTGSQRYNDRMDKIFSESKKLNEKYHGKDSFGSKKKELAKKMSIKQETRDNKMPRTKDFSPEYGHHPVTKK